MTNQETLDNAPEGATHYAPKLHYIARNNSGKWMRYDLNGFENAKWFDADEYFLRYADDYRSLADIRRIVELEDETTNLRDLLQHVLREHKRGCHLTGEEELKTSLQKRDLEQQAKSITYATVDLASTYGAIPVDALHEYAKQLRKQAGEL